MKKALLWFGVGVVTLLLIGLKSSKKDKTHARKEDSASKTPAEVPAA